jgi:hypothetical protein
MDRFLARHRHNLNLATLCIKLMASEQEKWREANFARHTNYTESAYTAQRLGSTRLENFADTERLRGMAIGGQGSAAFALNIP